MTTNEEDAAAKLERLNANLAKVEELSQRLVSAISRRKPADPGLQGPSSDVFMKAAAAYVAEMMHNPSKIIEHQVSYWGKSLKHYVEAQQELAKGV
jgi:polyhydroxyalkanoate synthase subunit PhaC